MSVPKVPEFGTLTQEETAEFFSLVLARVKDELPLEALVYEIALQAKDDYAFAEALIEKLT
jgi:hypothetical protein